jgi:alpha-amylase
LINETMIQLFHAGYPADGSLWDCARVKADYLAALGITACWLPPATKGASGKQSIGYDVYDLYDLGEFDQKGSVATKYGTKAGYAEAVDALHRAGIAVYADVILNHKAGADATERVTVTKVNPEDRNQTISGPMSIDAYTRFTFPGRQNRYSSFSWDYRCFTGIDYAADLRQKSIFKLQNGYGDSWQDLVAREKGNYDYLMFDDIDFRNPAVRRELCRWAAWFVQQAPIDGVRLDAVRHMPAAFINEWLDHLRAVKPGMFAVGEYWAPDNRPIMEQFLAATGGRLSLFDVALHQNFHFASIRGETYDLSAMFKNCLVETNPLLTVTFTDNHDTQPLQTLDTPVSDWFKPLAYSLILLREAGFPCVFYPDLFGASYTGTDKDGKQQEVQLKPCAALEPLLFARKRHALGRQRDYFNAANCIGWTREGVAGDAGSGCAVVLSNGKAASKKMEMGAAHAGQTFFDLVGARSEPVHIDDTGWGDFPVDARSVSVWVRR